MVEGARLEIVWAFMRLGGSNPLASATTPLGRFFRIRTSGSNPFASASLYANLAFFVYLI